MRLTVRGFSGLFLRPPPFFEAPVLKKSNLEKSRKFLAVSFWSAHGPIEFYPRSKLFLRTWSFPLQEIWAMISCLQHASSWWLFHVFWAQPSGYGGFASPPPWDLWGGDCSAPAYFEVLRPSSSPLFLKTFTIWQISSKHVQKYVIHLVCSKAAFVAFLNIF